MAKSFTARMRDRFKVITSSYDKANKYTHATAMEICKHAKEHGDCSLAQELVMALPASVRREMMILWFATYTPIVVKNDEKWNAKMHKPESKLFVEWNLEDGDAKPFYELAKENKERPPLDFEGLVKLVERLSNTIEKRVDNGEVNAEDIPTALDIARKLKGLKIRRIAADNDSPKVEEAAAAA